MSAGGGTLAQFSHPEFGGSGQWMSGGMTMVGDMFDYGLKATVSGLCSELSSLLSSQQVFVPLPPQSARGGLIAPGNNWWPAELGNPSSSGGQNNSRYAYFPQAGGWPCCITVKSRFTTRWITRSGACNNSKVANPARNRSAASSEPSALTLCHW